MSNYFVGHCVQCEAVSTCTAIFHVTCGHRHGASYKPSDWPYPITITCQRCALRVQSRQAEDRNLVDVDINTKVIAKHKNSRYYVAKVVEKWEQTFHHVHFVDNSFTRVLKDSDFLVSDLLNKHS